MGERDAWIEPGTFEVGPGVFRIPLPLPNDGLRAVNVYAVADGDQVVLIDSGWTLTESERLLRAGLDQIGYRLEDVREFLVTHIHRDHYSQAVAIRRVLGSPVSLGEGERANLIALQDRDAASPGRLAMRLRQAGAAGLADRVAGHPFDPALFVDYEDPDRWLADGVEIELTTRTLRAIATPGHTAGHVVFHDIAAGAIFAGDHVLPHITPSIGLQPAEAVSPLRDYLGSLRLMLTLPDLTLLPAHGPVTASTHARVDELLAHHEARLAVMQATLAAGASTAFEVAERIGWTRHERAFADLDEGNQTLAVGETLAHLIVIAERGWAKRVEIDGVDRFTPA